jgi:hypothetical protein
MGQIVTNNRATRVVPLRPGGPGRKTADQSKRLRYTVSWDPPSKLFVSAGQLPDMAILSQDLAVVREHFGLPTSRAFKLALHLTANAIRADKARPVVR